MTRRDWWLGVAAVMIGLLAHAAAPRHEWRSIGNALVRIDRWTGQAVIGTWNEGGGGRGRVWAAPVERIVVSAADVQPIK